MERIDKAVFRVGELKNGQATHIAPLQPPTLAMFPSWGIEQELVV